MQRVSSAGGHMITVSSLTVAEVCELKFHQVKSEAKNEQMYRYWIGEGDTWGGSKSSLDAIVTEHTEEPLAGLSITNAMPHL